MREAWSQISNYLKIQKIKKGKQKWVEEKHVINTCIATSFCFFSFRRPRSRAWSWGSLTFGDPAESLRYSANSFAAEYWKLIQTRKIARSIREMSDLSILHSLSSIPNLHVDYQELIQKWAYFPSSTLGSYQATCGVHHQTHMVTYSKTNLREYRKMSANRMH